MQKVVAMLNYRFPNEIIFCSAEFCSVIFSFSRVFRISPEYRRCFEKFNEKNNLNFKQSLPSAFPVGTAKKKNRNMLTWTIFVYFVTLSIDNRTPSTGFYKSTSANASELRTSSSNDIRKKKSQLLLKLFFAWIHCFRNFSSLFFLHFAHSFFCGAKKKIKF